MVTTRYSDQQGSKSRQKVMRLYKRWHRPISKRFIKPPYSIREQPRSTRNVVAYPRPAFSAKNRKNYAPTSFDQQVQVSQGHTFCTKIRKIEIPRSMVVEALNWWSRRASQHPAVQSPVHSWKSPTNLARSPLLVALVGRKMTVVRDQLFPQKPPGSSLWFSRTGVQPSPGSSTIELPSAFAESGAYPPDSRVLPGSPRQCSLPLACRHPPEGHQIGAREEARTWEHHHPQPTIPPPRLNRQAESRRQPVGCISWGWARPYTRRKDPPTLIPRNQQVSEGAGTSFENEYFLSALFAPDNLVSRDGFGNPVPRQPVHLRTQAESGAYTFTAFLRSSAASNLISSTRAEAILTSERTNTRTTYTNAHAIHFNLHVLSVFCSSNRASTIPIPGTQ